MIAERDAEVSALKNKLASAREREKRYFLHFSLTNEIMFCYDCAFRLRSVSPNVERITGYAPDELVGRCFHELGIVDPADMEDAIDNAQHVLSGKIVPASIYGVIRKNVERRYAEVSGLPKIHKGEVVGVISVARDITEQIELEKSLRESLEAARMLLDASSDSLILLNTEGTVLAMNEVAALRLGTTVKDALGKCVFSCMPESYTRSRKRHFEKVTRSMKPVHLSETRQGKHYSITIYPLFPHQGRPTRIAINGRETTPRRARIQKLGVRERI